MLATVASLDAPMWNNMMCDVMPTISEDSLSQRSSQYGGSSDENFEQLMINMLDERDKLTETLRADAGAGCRGAAES
ncbi:PREDICTED: liprin-alpha-2-like [Priapulus caudatus]|uniref:Liprin-alpha-2-like n=1 Tax=Priapulus caudatus TaxID=37621 RepID=A0ABM1ETU1_PRICU|nr:PREDICTED: liprin-alpha-2-like [Priapulus caudatus]